MKAAGSRQKAVGRRQEAEKRQIKKEDISEQ
jgi:hypothetical protein